MMKPVALGAALAACGVLLTGCGSPPDGGLAPASAAIQRVVHIGPQDSGTTVSLDVGDRLVVDLPAGFHAWAVLRHPPFLSPVRRPPRAGVFVFRADRSGHGHLTISARFMRFGGCAPRLVTRVAGRVCPARDLGAVGPSRPFRVPSFDVRIEVR